MDNWYKNKIGRIYWVTDEHHDSDPDMEYFRLDQCRTIKKTHCKILWPLIGCRRVRQIRKL
jgi:hypothetical protein